MLRSFESFKLEVIEKPFLRDDGFTTPCSAKVTLIDRHEKIIDELLLGYPSLNEVYEQIGLGKHVDLSNCFVQGFSLTACRRFLLKEKHCQLEINGFTARNALFVSTFEIDFSYALFLNGSVDFSGAIITGKCLTFHESVFSCDEIILSEIFVKVERFDMTQCELKESNLYMKNTIFSGGEKDFQDSDFGNGQISFTYTDFGDGDVSFINVRFNDGEANFKATRFGEGKVDFHYARFGKGNLNFERAEFTDGRVDFRTVEFGSGKVSFNRTIFGLGHVFFDGAEAKGAKFSFRKTDFGNEHLSFEEFIGIDSELYFEKIKFNHEVTFEKMQVSSLHLIDCQFNDRLNLHVNSVNTIDLSGCIIRDIVEYFSHGERPNVSMLNLSGIRLLGQILIDWNDNEVKKIIYNQKDTSIAQKAYQFRVLKENFRNQGKYNDEDFAYVEFKRCEEEVLLETNLKGSFTQKVGAYPNYLFKKLVFDYIGLYATAPARVFLSIAIVFLGFAGFYTIMISLGFGDIVSTYGQQNDMPVFYKSLYHSGITFFTIGYGDFVPVGAIRFFCGFEGFVGVFLMAYFTVAFVRKILR